MVSPENAGVDQVPEPVDPVPESVDQVPEPVDSAPERVRLTDTHLLLLDVAATVEVRFDGQRVWSVGPQTGAVDVDGWRRVRWPPAMHRFLDGSTRVRVVEPGSGQVVGELEHVFGDGAGRVSVVDARGRPVYVTKWGGAKASFDDLDPASRRSWLDTLGQLLTALRDECGVSAFLSYGSLLGAVRGGGFIGHDVDADVSYVSRYDHPLDVMRESYRIEATLRASGWRVRRSSGAFLQVFHRDAAGRSCNLDIFATFFLGEMMYEDFAVGARLRRSAVLPLGTTTLDGRSFPAPADPPAVLAATYGDGWSVPDPGFSFSVPPATRDRLRGWFGGYRTNRRDWSRRYRPDRAAERRSTPSDLARSLHAQAPAGALVVDVGCGDGVDTLWLARQGRRVLGLDFAAAGLRAARPVAAKERLAATFEPLNLYDARHALARGALLARSRSPVVVLARHVLDAVDEVGQRNAWQLMRLALSGGGSAYVQVHTRAPERANGDPQTYPVAPARLRAEAERHGASLDPLATAGPGTQEPARDKCVVTASWLGPDQRPVVAQESASR